MSQILCTCRGDKINKDNLSTKIKCCNKLQLLKSAASKQSNLASQIGSIVIHDPTPKLKINIPNYFLKFTKKRENIKFQKPDQANIWDKYLFITNCTISKAAVFCDQKNKEVPREMSLSQA